MLPRGVRDPGKKFNEENRTTGDLQSETPEGMTGKV